MATQTHSGNRHECAVRGSQSPPSKPGPPGHTSRAPAGCARTGGEREGWTLPLLARNPPSPLSGRVNLDVRLIVPGLGLVGGHDIVMCPVECRRTLPGGSANRHGQDAE